MVAESDDEEADYWAALANGGWAFESSTTRRSAPSSIASASAAGSSSPTGRSHGKRTPAAGLHAHRDVRPDAETSTGLRGWTAFMSAATVRSVSAARALPVRRQAATKDTSTTPRAGWAAPRWAPPPRAARCLGARDDPAAGRGRDARRTSRCRRRCSRRSVAVSAPLPGGRIEPTGTANRAHRRQRRDWR